MAKGGTASAWEDGIATLSDMGYKYLPPTTTGVSIDKALLGESLEVGPGMHAMNIVIEKESQIIDAELKMIEEWLEIIEEKQETTDATSTNYGVAGTATGTTTGTADYNQSDLDFITRKLAHIDQQINSLDTGVEVLQKKWEQIAIVGNAAQLANIDLQNMLQKQQQTLQTLSNISKTLHQTQESIIRNMR